MRMSVNASSKISFASILHVQEYNLKCRMENNYHGQFTWNGNERKNGYVLYMVHIEGGKLSSFHKSIKDAKAHFVACCESGTFIIR